MTRTRSRRSRNPLSYAFAKHVTSGQIAAVGLVTPTLRRIRITADAVADWGHVPGQHVRIQINDPLSVYGLLRPADTLRTYSVVAHRPDRREFEIWAHLYGGDGIGLRWARGARAGDPVTFWGPMGNLAVRPAPYHLFVGEETGSCAFNALLPALPPGQPAVVVAESDWLEDQVPLPAGATVHRVHRAGAAPASSVALLEAVRALDLPNEPGAAYLAGEALTGRAIRDHLVGERGWPRDAVTVKPFWTPGKRGLHH